MSTNQLDRLAALGQIIDQHGTDWVAELQRIMVKEYGPNWVAVVKAKTEPFAAYQVVKDSRNGQVVRIISMR